MKNRYQSFEDLGAAFDRPVTKDFFTSEMKFIIKLLEDDHSNVIIDAPAGTGKTTFAKKLFESYEGVLLTAVTGVAAKQFDGRTISRVCKLSRYNLEYHEIIDKNKENSVLKETHYLVIDEVGMYTWEQVYQVHLACQSAKNNFEDSFGGIKVLMMGDFCQLEPIEIREFGVKRLVSVLHVDKRKLDEYNFHRKTFTQIFRQSDALSLKFLSALRNMIYGNHFDKQIIESIRDLLVSNETQGLTIYSNAQDMPETVFKPNQYYYPIGDAPYASLPLMYGHDYLVTKNITDSKGELVYYNGQVIILTADNQEDFHFRDFEFVKIPITKHGKNALRTVQGDLISEHLALTPLTNLTVRRVQGSTFESGFLSEEFFSMHNRILAISQKAYLRTLYTALGRFTDLRKVGLKPTPLVEI